MSKVGKKPIELTDKVTAEVTKGSVKIKGPKGELEADIHTNKIFVEKEGTQLTVKRTCDDKEAKSCHGLYGALIRNMVKGVTEGFEKRLELVGVGYRAQKNGNGLKLSLGYSHPIEFKAVDGITITPESDTSILIQGIDKQKVGQVAANIRKLRKPEPYKGKGVKYKDEYIRRKAGKAGKA